MTPFLMSVARLSTGLRFLSVVIFYSASDRRVIFLSDFDGFCGDFDFDLDLFRFLDFFRSFEADLLLNLLLGRVVNAGTMFDSSDFN